MAAGYPVGIEPTSPEPQSGGLPLAYGHLIGTGGVEPPLMAYKATVLPLNYVPRGAGRACRDRTYDTLGVNQALCRSELRPAVTRARLELALASF